MLRPISTFSFVLALLLFTWGAPAFDEDTDLAYMTLNGLKTVTIQVQGIRDDYSRFGLTADAVAADVAQSLREHGISVVDLNTAKSTPGAALMRIKLRANESQFRFYFYGVSIELKQKIALNNPAGGFISGTIWKHGQTGTVMPTDLRRMNDRIGELIGDFLADYRQQNPKHVSLNRR